MATKKKAQKEESEIINLRDRVTMIGTGKKATHPEGVEFTVHPKLGERFLDKGIATMKD